MKPFTKHPVCPKCACGEHLKKAGGWRPTGVTSGVALGLFAPPPGERQFFKHCPRKAKQPEHLQVECSRCGFKWAMKVKT